VTGLDTGPIVALFDADDRAHAECLAALKGERGPLVTCWPVVTEAFYLLGPERQVQERLWTWLLSGAVRVQDLDRQGMLRCRELMSQYGDLALDLADAALVTACEVLSITRVFTTDRRDFHAIVPIHTSHFELLP
jgi:hypothetical protein